jgi:UDP-N-acetylglucosamine 2-epimerase
MAAVNAAPDVHVQSHLRRDEFVGVLKRLANGGGVLVGNSSAALIEAAALKLAAVDIGTRQNGRERCGNVIHVDQEYADAVRLAVAKASQLDLSNLSHPYGHGTSGVKIASILSEVNPAEPGFQRKRCTY